MIIKWQTKCWIIIGNVLECLGGEKEDHTEVVEILEVTTTTNKETKDAEMWGTVPVLPEVILPETQVNCYRDNNEEIHSQVQVHIPVNVAGRIKYFSHEWEILISDMVILDMVKGCHITFSGDQFPRQPFVPFRMTFTDWEQTIMDQEILKLLEKGVWEDSHCFPDTQTWWKLQNDLKSQNVQQVCWIQ